MPTPERRPEDIAPPRLDAAARALLGAPTDDLRDLRVAALGFKLVLTGEHPLAVAHAIDDEGDEHWLAIRSAAHGWQAAYLQLFAELLDRGLRASGPFLVDAGGCRWLAQRIDQELGPVVHAGAPSPVPGGPGSSARLVRRPRAG